MPKVVFLELPGIITHDCPSTETPRHLQILPDAVEGLRRLWEAGYALIVVTNQPGIALGVLAEADLRRYEVRLRTALADHEIPLAGFYYCPHLVGGLVPRYRVGCLCRKPHPGMLLRAAGEHRAIPRQSWMIGTVLDDVEAARRAGCRAIVVDAGAEQTWQPGELRRPDAIVRDTAEAAGVILAETASTAAQRSSESPRPRLRVLRPEPVRAASGTAPS